MQAWVGAAALPSHTFLLTFNTLLADHHSLCSDLILALGCPPNELVFSTLHLAQWGSCLIRPEFGTSSWCSKTVHVSWSPVPITWIILSLFLIFLQLPCISISNALFLGGWERQETPDLRLTFSHSLRFLAASAQTTTYNPLLTFKCMQNLIPHKCAWARSWEFRKFQPENEQWLRSPDVLSWI